MKLESWDNGRIKEIQRDSITEKLSFKENRSLTSERMSYHCEGGRKGHHHFQASLGLDDSYAIRKVMWIFQQPSNHPKNGLKLFLKELSYFYAPAFSWDIIVQGVLALCEFHYCKFCYYDFSKLSINICLMWILGYFISLQFFGQ